MFYPAPGANTIKPPLQLARSSQSSSSGKIALSDGQGRVKYSGTGGRGRGVHPSNRACSWARCAGGSRWAIGSSTTASGPAAQLGHRPQPYSHRPPPGASATARRWRSPSIHQHANRQPSPAQTCCRSRGSSARTAQASTSTAPDATAIRAAATASPLGGGGPCGVMSGGSGVALGVLGLRGRPGGFGLGNRRLHFFNHPKLRSRQISQSSSSLWESTLSAGSIMGLLSAMGSAPPGRAAAG